MSSHGPPFPIPTFALPFLARPSNPQPARMQRRLCTSSGMLGPATKLVRVPLCDAQLLTRRSAADGKGQGCHTGSLYPAEGMRGVARRASWGSPFWVGFTVADAATSVGLLAPFSAACFTFCSTCRRRGVSWILAPLSVGVALETRPSSLAIDLAPRPQPQSTTACWPTSGPPTHSIVCHDFWPIMQL